MCVVVCCCCCPQTVFPFRFWSSPHLGDFKKVALFSFFIIFSSLLLTIWFSSSTSVFSLFFTTVPVVPCTLYVRCYFVIAFSSIRRCASARCVTRTWEVGEIASSPSLEGIFPFSLSRNDLFLNKIIITMIIIRKILIEICGFSFFAYFSAQFGNVNGIAKIK